MPAAVENQSELRYPKLPATHWKNRTSGAVNRDKRVAYGCKVEEKNIKRSTRSRKEPVTYNDKKLTHMVVDGVVPLKKKVVSVNVLEKRSSALKNITNSKRVSKQSKTTKKSSDSKKSETSKKKKTVTKKEEASDAEEAQQEEIATKTVSRKAGNRRRRSTSKATEEVAKEEELSKAVRTAMEKFGGVLSEKTIKMISSTYLGKPIPKAILQFSALALGMSKNRYKNTKINEFFVGTELATMLLPEDEWKKVTGIAGADDFICIGSGDLVLLVKSEDKSGDFEVVLVDDDVEAMTTYGPFKISQIMKNMEIDSEEDEDME